MTEEFNIEATVQELNDRLRANSRAATIRDLAERLFVADYPSATEATSKRIAEAAFDAAEAFLVEAERRAKQCSSN